VSALEEFRIASEFPEPGPAPAGSWRLLELEDLDYGLVLGVDPSLRATGWALVWRNGAGAEVLAAGKLTTAAPPGRVNWDTRVADAVSIHRKFRELYEDLRAEDPRTMAAVADDGHQLVVHREKPPTGKQVRDPFSSALAGTAVEIACAELSVPTSTVDPQGVKFLLTGRRGGDKKPVQAALARLGWLGGRELLTNDATRDAAAIALHRLARGGTR
jgi:Holliday junction resolvasome RuvABC endonuclease subunit